MCAAARSCWAWSIVGVLLFPIWNGNDADIDSMANAAAYATLALGLNIVVGFAGLLDLGYAAFFAIGAYTYGILTAFQLMPEWSSFWEPFQYLGLVAKFPAETGDGFVVHFTLSFWLALPFAAVFAAFWGVLFGAPTLRLRGDYLAIVTLGFGEIVPIVVRNWSSLTNGAAGLNGVAAPRLFGWSFGVSSTPYYYVAMVMVALLMFVSIRLRDSRIGRAWMAIREDEIAASAMGVEPDEVQAAGLRHRRCVRRHDRRVLRRQVADRDAGDVRLPGLGHDAGDGGVRRHRQRLGRGARRLHPAAAAVLVAAGPAAAGCTRSAAWWAAPRWNMCDWCNRSS